MKKISVLITIFLFTPINASASSVLVKVVPTTWRLQNYIGDGVTVYYTGSPCTSGKLSLPSNTSMDDKNRFWSVVMAGKASGKKIFVYYENTSPGCDITSFGLSEE